MKSFKELLKPSAPQKFKHKIGICLSGGGALGFAHIGVLQALEDHRIFPETVSGSSIGSIIGAMYCAGYTPSQMLQFIKEGKLYKITKIMQFQPAFWKAGLSNHSTILSLVNEFIPNNSFEKLDKPMHVCVSNLNSGKWEIISKSEKLDIWIAASCSIPGIFNSIKINNNVYVDGGLLNNVPAQPLRETCEYVIGSDVIPHLTTEKSLQSRDVLVKSIRVAQHQSSQAGRKLCDFLIEPKAIKKFNEFSFDAYQAIYQYGYRAATKFIGENPDLLKLANYNEKQNQIN
ncbi:MAG TPA: hypothetical protein GXZ87_05175 [Bacteroidales bacterium]|nr:hypothetical protein [Bacteroidales bacterium]